MAGITNSIKLFQWGNSLVARNKVDTAIVKAINNISQLLNNSFDNNCDSSFKTGKFSIVSNNKVSGSSQFKPILSGYSIIDNNIIRGNSNFYLNLKSSTIVINDLNKSLISFTIDGKSIMLTNFNCNINIEVSAGTVIFEGYLKTIFARPDGTPRLSYYDNTDTLQIVDVDA